MSAQAIREASVDLAAVLNPQTSREQQQEIARLKNEVWKAQGDIADLRKRLKASGDRHRDYETAVVLLDGKRLTLSDILDKDLFDPLCACKDRDCGGCLPSDAELKAEYEAEGRDV